MNTPEHATLGIPIAINESVPTGAVFVAPSWIGECKILAGVAVRYRGLQTKDGKTWHVYSPLTESELHQIRVINNLL